MVFSFFAADRNSSSKKNQRRARPAYLKARRSFLEALEDRSMMATLTWVGDIDANWNAGTDTVDTNWNTNTLPVDGDTLIFAGAAPGALNNDTATLNSYTLQFNAGGYTIAGNSITLDNASDDVTDGFANTVSAPLVLDATSTANISAGVTSVTGNVSGVALTKTGLGTLLINGATNSYTGGTTVSAGVLNTGSASALGTGSLTNNATVDLNAGGVGYTFAGMSGNGTLRVLLGTGVATTTLAVGSYAGFTGNIQVGISAAPGAGKFLINNMASLPATATINVLPNATVYVSAGTFAPSITLNGGDTGESLGQLRMDGGLYNGSLTLAGNITGGGDSFVGANGGTGVIAGIISESGGVRTLSKAGAGTIALTNNANSYAGGTTIISGPLSVGNNTATGALGTGTVAISGSLVVNRNNAISIPNLITAPGAGILTKVGAGTLTFTTPGGGNVFKTVNLNSNSTIDFGGGNTTISNGGGSTITSSTGGIMNATGGTLLIGSGGVANGPDIGSANGTTLTINATMSLIVPTNAFEVFQVANGTGVVVLTATNNFAGPVFINSGVLSVASLGDTGVAGNLGTGSIININSAISPPTLRYTGAATSINRTINLSGGVNLSAIEHNGSGPLTFTSNFTATGAGSKTLILQGTAAGANGGQISGAIVNNSGTNLTALAKNGTGAWTLSGTTANTYTGNTIVNDGVLNLNKTGVNAIAGGTLQVGNGGANDSDILLLLAANQIADTVNVDVRNSGLFNLGGLNETIAGLTLQTGGVGIGASANTGGGTLTLGGNVTVNNAAAGDVTSADITGSLDLGGATRTFTVNNATVDPDLFVNGSVSNGAVIKAGAGQMRYIGAANTYTGNTTVNEGILQLSKAAGIDSIAGGTLIIGDGVGGNDADRVIHGAADQINNAVNVDVRNSGLFNLNTFNETIAALAMQTGTGQGGSITTSGATLNLSGNVNVTNVVASDNTAADITGGALDLGNVIRTFTVADATANPDLLLNNVILINGTLDKQGPGNLQYTGTAVSGVNMGAINVGAGTFTHAGSAINFGLGGGIGTLTVQSGAFFTSTSSVLTNGALNVLAGGTARFTAATTAVASINGAGNLILGNTTGSGTVALTIGSNNLSTTFSGPISQAAGFTGSITKTGSGNLTLGGTNTYTGTTFVNDGRLDLTGTLTSAVSVNSSAIFGGSGSTTGTINANNTSRVSPGLQSGATVGRLTTTAATTIISSTFLDIELAGTNGVGVAGGHDQLRTSGVTLSGATLNLSGIYAPTEATLSSFMIVENTSLSPTVSRLNIGGNILEEGEFINFNGGKLFISYLGGDGNDVVLSTQLMGSFLPNLVTLTPVSSNSIAYSIDGINTYTVSGITRFTFNGGGNDDVLAVMVNGFVFPGSGIFYNGDTQGAPGANPSHGDVLSVVDLTNAATAAYRPDGVANPALDNDGRVLVSGGGNINFTGLEPVDIAGFASVTIQPANGDDVINIDNGFDAASGFTVPAIVVSGSSGGVPFESVHLSSNTTVTIDTTLVGGNDTITVNSASNAHLNQNLNIATGTGIDTVTFDGNATFTGTVIIASQNIAFNGGLLTAGNVLLGAGTGAISTNGTGVDISATNLTANATTGVDLDTNVTTIFANTSGAGNIRFDETDGVTLSNITVANGSMTANAAGLVIAGFITSTTDADANDVTIFTSVSDIVVLNIATGGTASDVTLTASTGSILDNANDVASDITGDVVTLTAALGVGEVGGNGAFDTSAQSLDVSVTGVGLIAIDELNAVTLTAVDTANGPITIIAGSAILATNVTSSTSNDANDINLTALTGNITIGIITSGTVDADVAVTAVTGSLIDNANDLITDVTGDLVSFNAPLGLIGNVGTQNIDTAANRITFAAANGAWINELNAVTVIASAGTATGPVVFSAGGNITLQTTINAATGNVLVTTTGGGDLILDTNALITSGAAAGAVRLNIANSIVDTQATNDILATNVNITAGNDVGSLANPIESTITNLGATTAAGGDFYLNERDDLNITTVTAFGNTQTGLNIGGVTLLNTGFDPASTSATMNVINNVTGTGDVTLRAIDRSGAADSIVLTNGVAITSTTGDLTLGFGDAEILNATHKLDVGPTRTINLFSIDVDNGSNIQLQGTVSAKTVNVVGANNNDFFVLKADTILDNASTLNLTGKDGSDTYGNAVDRINPTNALINIEGDSTFNLFPEARPGTDSLFLDASVLTAPVVFFAGRVKGTLEGGDAKFQKVNYEDLEALTFYDNGTGGANSGDLTTVVLGPLYVRGTTFADDINFIRFGPLGSTDVQTIIKWNGMQKYFGPFPMGAVDPAGKLVVFGKEGNDTIRSSLSGTIPGTNRDVEFHGGLGNDYLVGGTGNALMIGDEGNDTINTSASQAQHNVVIWGDAELSYDNHEGSIFPIATFPDGNDNIITGPSNDLIFGAGGNDTIGSAAGNDIIYGGSGIDTIYGGDGNDLIRGSTGNDVLSGDNGDDLILGDDGSDKVYGRAGNDILIGGAGNDLVDGFTGNDVVTGGLATAFNDISTLANARAHEAALLALLSNWVTGGTFAATITDDLVKDNVTSGSGNDRLYVHEVALDPTNDINDFVLGLDTKFTI